MAEYQIGSQTYELPDNLPPQQLNQILSQLAGQQANNEPDTSFSSAFQSGVDAPLENMATTARMLGADGTADTLSGLTQAPTNYESASDRFMNPEEGDFTVAGFAPGYLPRAAAEQAGQFAGSVATRVGGGAAGLAVSGGNPIVGAAGALAGPALFEFVQQLGPVAAQRAKNNGRTEPNWEDWTAAAGTAGLSGALNSIGVKGFNGAGLLNRTLKEGVTETAQSVVEQTGSTAGTDAGLQINPKQAIGEGIIGGTSAGGVSVATDTVSGAANLTGRGLRAAKDAVVPSDTPSDAEAAADFAADLQRVSDEDGYNLKDVDTGSATGARAAVDTLHMEYGSQIEVMVSDLVDRLKETADDTQLQALEKAKANAAKRKAKNKVKSRVDPTDFQVIEKLTAGTDEGAKLIALMRKSNELSALANKSVKGGISQFTDVFNPLDSDGRYNIGRAIAAPVSGLGAIASGGASLAPAIAGRAIDAVTGRRSRVANYVRQNQGNQGIQIPNLPSERTRKQQEQAAKDQAALAEEERKKALALEATQLNDPPKGFSGDQTPSPQYAMETGTGLTRRGVADALKVLRRTRPKLSKAIDTYQTMLETGQQSDDLTPLIRAVKGLKKKYPQLFDDTQGETDNSAAIPTSTAESPNIKRGIESNLKFAQDQIDKVDADNNMSDFDKIVAKDALRELSANLGSDPVASAEGILKKAKVKARKKPKIDEHVKPYVDRVKRQQKQAKKPEGVEQIQNMAMFDPINIDEYDTSVTYYHGTASAFKEFDAGKRGEATKAKSAKMAHWFTDNVDTAQTYADHAALSVPVQNLLDRQKELETQAFNVARKHQYETGEIVDPMSLPEAARLLKLSEEAGLEAERLEPELLRDADTQGQNLVPVYLPKNLHEIDAGQNSYMDFRDNINEGLQYAKANGFDGLKITNLSDDAAYMNFRPATHIAIFDPEKIRSKFASKEEAEAAQLEFKPFLTEELMERPLDEREIEFNETEKGIYQLRNQLERMQMRPGEGILSNRKKSADIGNMQLDFDHRKASEYRKGIIKEAVASLDPEGRELMSKLQVGLNGDGGVTNEQIAILVPSIVRSIEFMTGSQADERNAYGRYAKFLTPQGNLLRNRIEVTDIGQKVSDGTEVMHTGRFLDTLLHEIGHAIGDRSDLDQLVSNTMLLGRLEPDESYYKLMDQLTNVSKQRRRKSWETLDNNLENLHQRTGYYFGPARLSYQLKLDSNDDVENLANDVHQRAMANGQLYVLDQIPKVVRGIASQIRYLNNPKELVADAVSYYLQKPAAMKKLYPELAKVIRKGVNESSVAEHITFHSLAGLLGAAGMMAAVQAAITGEDDKEERPGILNLLQPQGILQQASI